MTGVTSGHARAEQDAEVLYIGGRKTMTPEIKLSNILEHLLENAKQLGDKRGPLTAERFIVAAIDYSFNVQGIFYPESETYRIVNSLRIGLHKVAGDLLRIRKGFWARINSRTDNNLDDSIYMENQLKEACETALQLGKEELSADALLERILVDPNPYIAQFDNPDAFKREKIKQLKALQSLIEKIRQLKALQSFDKQSNAKTNEFQKRVDDMNKIVVAKKTIAELTERVKKIHDSLSGIVLGQDNAISTFTTGYFQSELLAITNKERNRPRATFLFAGPPGVGKTILAESIAKELQLPFKRFDMSEYCDKEASLEFIGTDAAYKESKKGNFTGFVEANPRSVVLLDEIEKAHTSIIYLFLQILDAGRIRDSHSDAEINLTDTILIFTTNAGKQLYEHSETGDFSGMSRKVILKALEDDINPLTKRPYFPAAICSRFASGNVVMFNRIEAHTLRRIAKQEILRHSDVFGREVGIDINIDENVYTALMLSEGGNIDARTMRSRAEAFFNTEIFELFRLLPHNNNSHGIETLKTINIGIDINNCCKEISTLFKPEDTTCVAVATSEQVFENCKKACPDAGILNVQSVAKAKKVLKDNDVDLVVIDMSLGRRGKSKLLNLQDVDSTARDIFWYIRENYTDLPVYIFYAEDNELNAEERRSFLSQGVRGFVCLSCETNDLYTQITELIEMIHWQKSVDMLAKANKLVTFETSQQVSEKGKKARIKLFDFELATAVDAADTANVLSSVSKPDVKFDQVIGAEEAKKELRHFIEYLKNPKKFRGTGLSAPKGVILYGPPGTGKTMLAKAMASESDVTFISAEGNQFLKSLVGEGAEKVHEIFRTARKYAPAVLFIDEIDAIAKERKGGDNSAAAEATLTAFLAEMDGFKKDHAKPVFVLAATNFDVESGSSKSLDPALMRRFDRRILVDLPSKAERKQYLLMKTENNTAFDISENMLENIATRSSGMSPAALESMLELSLRMAIRVGNMKVTDRVLEEAFETFTGGATRKRSEATLERTARHEAGHALLCWMSGETPSYLTIVARGNYGGYMQHGDNEDKGIYTKQELLSRIRIALGGRAAEIVYYGEEDGLSTGAGGDLNTATVTAMSLMCGYGMDEDFGLAVIDYQSARSGELSSQVRTAVNKVLDNEMKNTIDIIKSNRSVMDELVETLLAKSRMTGDEIKALLEGKCKQSN